MADGCWARCLRWTLWLPIPFMLFFISYNYYAYVLLFALLSVPSWTHTLLYTLFGNFFLFFWLWTYLRAILTPRARPPKEYTVPEEVHGELIALDKYRNQADANHFNTVLVGVQKERELEIYTRELAGYVRYCATCRAIKPDRCHHCSTCGHCVLKYDHHCPWLNTCVNFANYKFFVLLLVHTQVLCAYVIGTSVPWLWPRIRDTEKWWREGRIMALFVMNFVCSTYALATFFLLGYHLFLIAKGRTTLEHQVHKKVTLRDGSVLSDPFHEGLKGNFKAVFGSAPLFWLLPLTPAGDGDRFSLRDDWSDLAVKDEQSSLSQ